MKPKFDIEFVKRVACDEGHPNLSDTDAKKAHKLVVERCARDDYYYSLREYFRN